MTIKWIKINTSMFDDEKIKFIESLPNRDTTLIIWVKLLTQAGKCNAGGFVMLTENIPFTEESLAGVFNRPINDVRFALKTFQELEMIELYDGGKIAIANWEKHQNVEGMEKLKEQNAERQKRFRQKQQQILIESGAMVTDEIPFKEIVEYLNEKAGKKYKASSDKTKKCIRARWNERHRFEDFKQVIDNKVGEWMGTEWESYLRPETLFGTKFEGYLNQKQGVRKGVGKSTTKNAIDAFLNGENENE